jgi:ATP-binding cassette subfamily B protein
MSALKVSDIGILKRLLRMARAFWPHVGATFAIDLLAAPVALLAPVPLMLAVDSVINGKPLPPLLQAVVPDSIEQSNTSLIWLVAVMVVLIALLGQAQKLGLWLLQTYTGEKLSLDFRARLLRHAQRLSLAYHDTRGTSDAIYRIQYDAPAIQWVVVHGITPFFTAGLTLVGMVLITAQLDWQLALVALTISPILLLLTQVFRKRLRTQWRDVKELETSALSVIQEILGALRVVKAFGQEEREHNRFLRRANASLAAHIRVIFSESAFTLGIGITIAVGTAIVLYLGVTHVQAGLLSLGQLLLVMSYLAQLYGPLETLGQQVARLQGGLASAERAFALLDERSDVPEKPNAQALQRAKGAVQFEGVCFAYDPAQPVLQDVSFSIPAGSRVGIAGKTGAGKTTLINMLTRFYDPSSGRILLDDVDLRDYRLADLRDQYAIVLQDPVLFSTSIGENIAYARPGATHEQVIAAAKAADAHDFIRSLPDGYDTLVGERGMRLSGGQRQRIALARAFLKDAPILILDEPTSAVDVKTEAAIMATMNKLMRGRTTFMIAHRLSTLEQCDVLLFLEGGRLLRSMTGLTQVTTRTVLEEQYGASAGDLTQVAGSAR